MVGGGSRPPPTSPIRHPESWSCAGTEATRGKHGASEAGLARGAWVQRPLQALVTLPKEARVPSWGPSLCPPAPLFLLASNLGTLLSAGFLCSLPSLVPTLPSSVHPGGFKAREWKAMPWMGGWFLPAKDACQGTRATIAFRLPPPGAVCHCRQQQEEWARGQQEGRGAQAPQSPGLSWLCLQGCGCWPRERRKVPLLPSPLEGDRASVFPGNRVGARGPSEARECCPRRASSLGSQGRVPGPLGTARSCL